MHKPTIPVNALDFNTYLERHVEWGWKTFGTPAEGRGPKGPLDHVLKEVQEIMANPSDVTEWVDAIILTIDGFIRAGGTGEVLKLDRVCYLAGVERATWRKPLVSLQDTLKKLLVNPFDLELWRHAIFLSMVGYIWANKEDNSEMLMQIFAKQRKNFNRVWPDWKLSDPDKAVEHVRGIHD